jgi:hypothetical protein
MTSWSDVLSDKHNGEPRGEYRTGPSSGGTPYATAALERECREVAEAPEGTRNDRLNRAAFAVFQLVAGGELAESDAWSELRASGKACGLGDHEIDATISSGAKAGTGKPRQAPPRPDRVTHDDPSERIVLPRTAGNTEPLGEQDPGFDPGPDPEVTEPTLPALLRYRFLSMADLFAQVVAELGREKPRAGVSTGNAELDIATGGFRSGHITVFGAKQGFGKTTYGNFIKLLGGQHGYRVIVIAGEDPAIMYGKRFLAAVANLNALLLRDNQCRKDDWRRITDAQSKASTKPFFWRTDGAPAEKVAGVIRAIGSEEQIDLVIVDYLQCIQSRKQLERRNEVTFVLRLLCDSIRSINAAGLVFSQLRRTERTEPELEDLKESGDIEIFADHVLLGWKSNVGTEDNPNVQRWIKLAKNKDGTEAEEIGKQNQTWDRKTASFQFTGPTRRAPAGYESPDDFSDLDAPPPNYQDVDNEAIDGRYT